MTPEQQQRADHLGCQAHEARGHSHTRKQCGNAVTHWHEVYGELCADHVREMGLSGKCITIAERAQRLATSDERQRRADHLALVAAPILAVMLAGVSNKAALEKRLCGSFTEIAVKAAELLQRAAEERVSK